MGKSGWMNGWLGIDCTTTSPFSFEKESGLLMERVGLGIKTCLFIACCGVGLLPNTWIWRLRRWWMIPVGVVWRGVLPCVRGEKYTLAREAWMDGYDADAW